MSNKKLNIPVDEIANAYQTDRQAIRKYAVAIGCSVQTIYHHLHAAGIKMRSGGDAKIGVQAGSRNPNWAGGKHLDAAGYVVVRTGPNTTAREHRLVAAEMLGRPLQPGEVVHHINGDRSDNRPDNLEVLPSQSEHMRRHMTSEEARKRAGLAALKAVGGLSED